MVGDVRRNINDHIAEHRVLNGEKTVAADHQELEHREGDAVDRGPLELIEQAENPDRGPLDMEHNLEREDEGHKFDFGPPTHKVADEGEREKAEDGAGDRRRDVHDDAELQVGEQALVIPLRLGVGAELDDRLPGLEVHERVHDGHVLLTQDKERVLRDAEGLNEDRKRDKAYRLCAARSQQRRGSVPEQPGPEALAARFPLEFLKV